VCGGEILRPGLDQVHAVRGRNGPVEQWIFGLRGLRCGKVLHEHAAGSGLVRELCNGLLPRDDGRDELPGLLRGPVLERDRLGLSIKLRGVWRWPVRGPGFDGMHAMPGRKLSGLDGLASMRELCERDVHVRIRCVELRRMRRGAVLGDRVRNMHQVRRGKGTELGEPIQLLKLRGRTVLQAGLGCGGVCVQRLRCRHVRGRPRLIEVRQLRNW